MEMSEVNCWVIVPAAGVGTRMGASIPKQYLELRGRPVIDHTLERVLLHPKIDGVYVAIAEDDGWWADTEFANHPDLVRVGGGSERCHSVLNALAQLQSRAQPKDWVLVHDAARPCLRRTDVDHLMAMLESHAAGGLLGVPVRDTMKRTSKTDEVVDTVDRNNLWHAYTPQMFRFERLLNAMRGAIDAGYLVTDEASAIEWAGDKPLMVEGHPDNIKITRPEDLPLAEFYLSQQG